jgi:hypothetical protein
LFIPTLNEDSTAFTPIIQTMIIGQTLLKIRAKKLRVFNCAQSPLSRITKSISAALSFLLLITFISFGISPSANASVPATGLYGCSSGTIGSSASPNYVILNGIVEGGNFCNGHVVIPTGVTGIGTEAFKAFAGGPVITGITIPNTVTSIGRAAFEDQIALSSLTIPSSVTSIGADAFWGAILLTTLSIPDSVTSIGRAALAGTSALTSFTVGAGNPNYSSVGGVVFNKNKTELVQYPIGNTATSYTIPDTVLSISDFAFNRASTLTSLAIPNSVQSIGADSFSDMQSLTTLTIPNSVTSIGFSAFSNLSSMTELTISNTLTSISAFAFWGASSLQTLSIPNSVISIGDDAFSNATSLRSLYMSNRVTSIGDYAFFRAISLTTLSIPNSVTSIGSGAFASAVLLTTLTIPNSVTSIGSGAFAAATSLTTLTIPNSVTSIGGGTFVSTMSLTEYTYCGTALSQAQLDDAYLNGKTRISVCSITAPGAPTISAATATGKRSATISFAAPASNGGSVITSYSATSIPGGITKTLTQAGGGTFTFDTLQPGTSYTFAVTATNNIGTSAAATSNSIKTIAADVASIASLTFSDDGSGTAGKIAWAGKNIDSVLYSGPSSSYPGPFNYGAFTSGWNGTIRNLMPETSYTISIFAVSVDGVGESKSLTFKTGAKDDVVKNLAYWNSWLKTNTFLPNEADSLISLLNKFNALETSSYRSYLKVPNSRVLTVAATSLTPKSCSVIATTAKVDAGLVKALTNETCTISYTVSGGSKAPATLVKDFVFKKVG